MNVLHLPTSVGGNSYGLSRGERALGLQSDVLVMFPNRFGYPSDHFIFKNPPGNVLSTIAKRFWIPRLFREVLSLRKRYDVFHFNFGTSLLDFWMIGLTLLDIPLFKKYGKIVVTYNGCDARQKFPTIERTELSACHDERCSAFCNSGIHDWKNRKRITKFDRYADAVFSVNPDIMHFLPDRAGFLPYTVARWNMLKTLPFHTIKKKIKVIHAPSHRITKGTSIILDALDKIKERYGDIVEIDLIENVSHEEALQRYADADLVIDQILIGFYGGFAVETMKMGKPVMAYIRKEDLKFMPEHMAEDCVNTIIQASPKTIFSRLCEIVENPKILKNHRNAALDYVNRWHDPVYVAGITKSVYESI